MIPTAVFVDIEMMRNEKFVPFARLPCEENTVIFDISTCDGAVSGQYLRLCYLSLVPSCS